MTGHETAGTGPTARRMVLGNQLRRLREAADISRDEAGYHIRGSGSKISRLELGRVSFKERDVVDLLTYYGVTEEDERAAFLDMVRQSNQPGWWHRYNDLMPSWFQDYVGLEESTSRLQTYEVQFVPGLLQTEDYARAVTRGGKSHVSDAEVERRVTLRLQRQRLLSHPQAPRLWAVLDEAVLHRPVGGKEVLREQLDHLLDLVRWPTIALQVLPFRIGSHAAEGAFTLLRFNEPELPDIVYLEHPSGALYLDKPDEIEIYSQIAHQLAVQAETPDASRRMLERIRSEL